MYSNVFCGDKFVWGFGFVFFEIPGATAEDTRRDMREALSSDSKLKHDGTACGCVAGGRAVE